MTDVWKQQVGQTIDGQFRLIQYLGGTDHSAVFLTEFGDKRQRFAIKLIGADPAEADAQLARLRRAAKLSHPHLARIFQVGRAQVGSASVLYVITEYAEEDLAQILPDRPLRPDEVREMLPLILDALQYLHSHGFVHARLKPSNILAVDDQLKLSSDGICAPHERGSSGEKASPYDPPELAPAGPSTAGDVWSLGMTLVEVLTQRLPIWEWTGHADPPAPRTLPAPFLEITRNCLRRDPAMRCTLREISENLDPQPVAGLASGRPASVVVPGRRDMSSSISVGTGASVGAAAARSESKLARESNAAPQKSLSRYAVQAAAFVLALAAILIVPRFLRQGAKPLDSEQVSAAAPADEPSKIESVKPEPVRPDPANEESIKTAPVAKKSPSAKPPEKDPKLASAPSTSASKAREPRPAAVTPAPPPAHIAETATAAAPAATPKPGSSASASASSFTRGQVAHKVMPDVSHKALNTIHGKVRVSVQLNVDAAGKVTDAKFEAPGPSKYFADAALSAAKHWTFAPAKSNGANVPSHWLLRFEFVPVGPEVFSAEINP
jgi:TonB family protein